MKIALKIIGALVGLFLVVNIEGAPVTTVAGVALIIWAITGKLK